MVSKSALECSGVSSGHNFVIADRPVVWGFDGQTDVTPAALRLPNVQVFATLTRSIALVACHESAGALAPVHYSDVNRIFASAAAEWIAGPTREVVAESLASRVRGCKRLVCLSYAEFTG
jgi:hypothetical protein